MSMCVIHNPYANRWRSGKRRNELEHALQQTGRRYELRATEYPVHAMELAREAARSGDFEAVIAAGGDGTVSEVANGLLQGAGDHDPTVPFGILPIGTGNDFATMAGVPRKPVEAAARLRDNQTQAIDAIRLHLTHDGDDKPPRYFINNAAIGMEPLVTVEAAKVTWISGSARYLVGLGQALRQLKAWHLKVEWTEDEDDEEGHTFEGPGFMLSLCNSPRTGGMFRMAPDAKLSDGLLDFVIVPELPMRSVLGLLPKILSGKHVHDPRVIYRRATHIEASIGGDYLQPQDSAMHADGEILTQEVTRLSAAVQPGRLRLLV